jgi:glycerophosphoryl diester phosphodiesterase
MVVWVYTVNRRDDADRARALGVDGVFSDVPDEIGDAQDVRRRT